MCRCWYRVIGATQPTRCVRYRYRSHIIKKDVMAFLFCYNTCMNTVHKGLLEAAGQLQDPEERYDFYVNYSIDYLRERVEYMMINAGDLDATVEMCRRIEGALDDIEGV